MTLKTMTPELWERAEAIFGAALERTPDEREAFLDRRCAGDPELRRRVERLLAADGAADEFLAKPLLEELPSPGDRATPRRLGPYRLVRKLGEGGMSTVYLAVRADGEVRRRVAIKCLRSVSADPDQRRRLERERQILASLDHPSIACLYDVGATGDGLPYFVMEYVEGEPVTAYCDRHRLTISERLNLFREVCAAVHYAHQNLIVHRDLKPSNILVTEDGVPKLLDFGIAKWLNPELTSRQLAMTAPWQRFLTPDYASPEQLLGQPVTTASDVHSLGLLLFELLTGRRPRRLEGLSPREIERVVDASEPILPSVAVRRSRDDSLEGGPDAGGAAARRLDPAKLARRLTGDLDTIVAKALRREPGRRHGSAAQLAEDLRCHLAGLPVAARQPTLGYRASRFLRRNRLAAAVGAAFLVLLIVSVAGLGFLSVRLAEERDKAREERHNAIRVSRFFQGILEQVSPQAASGVMIPAREIIDRAAEQLDDLETEPAVFSEVANTLGKVYNSLGLLQEAAAMHEAALEHRRTLLGEDHILVAGSLMNLGTVRLVAGDLAGAEAAYRRSLAIRRSLYPGDHINVAAALRSLGQVMARRDPSAEAEAIAREAVAMYRRLRDENHRDVTNSLYDLGITLYYRHDLAGSERLHRQVLERRRAMFGGDHLMVAASLQALGVVLTLQEGYPEAEAALLQSQKIMKTRLTDEHPFRIAVDRALGELFVARGDASRAETHILATLAKARSHLAEDHPTTAALLLGLGRSRLMLDRPATAEEPLRESLASSRRVLVPNHPQIAIAGMYLGACLDDLDRDAEAEELLVSSRRILAAQDPPRPRQLAFAQERLVRLYEALGQAEQAEGDNFVALDER